MSGGSFNYLEHEDVRPACWPDLLRMLAELRLLRLYGEDQAEDEPRFELDPLAWERMWELVSHINAAHELASNLGAVFHAVEWWSSRDWFAIDAHQAIKRWAEGERALTAATKAQDELDEQNEQDELDELDEHYADPTAAHWWDRAELINWTAEVGALTPVRFRHTCDDYISVRTLTEALSAAAQHQCPDAGKGQVTSITHESLTRPRIMPAIIFGGPLGDDRGE